MVKSRALIFPNLEIYCVVENLDKNKFISFSTLREHVTHQLINCTVNVTIE